MVNTTVAVSCEGGRLVVIERSFNREGSHYLACNDRNAFLTLENSMHDLVKMY